MTDPRQLEFPFLEKLPVQRFYDPELDRIVEEVYGSTRDLKEHLQGMTPYLRLLMSLPKE